MSSPVFEGKVRKYCKTVNVAFPSGLFSLLKCLNGHEKRYLWTYAENITPFFSQKVLIRV